MKEYATDPAFQFDEIAFLYDELMQGVAYPSWVKYLNEILDKYVYKPKTILDLCCGTGRVSRHLADEGYEVTGVDISPEMITRARQNADVENLPIEYHVQDASQLQLNDTFDLVISFFDSLNYILDIKKIQQCFNRISTHLNPSGMLIFDMNTELALATGMFDQNNIGSKSDVIYNWKSSYDKSVQICSVEMDFTYKNSIMKHVTHYQRAYSLADIAAMLGAADLEVVAVLDAYSFKRANTKSDRIFFVARKS
ncbi:MAG: class I SAM-dependent DNA methyltransferase [Armatimonadota bacterium]